MTLFSRRVLAPLPPISAVVGGAGGSTAADAAVTASSAGPTNLLINPSFELPIIPDVAVPVGGWDIYQTDFQGNPSQIPFSAFERVIDWASDGTYSLRVQNPELVSQPAATLLGVVMQKTFTVVGDSATVAFDVGAAIPPGSHLIVFFGVAPATGTPVLADSQGHKYIAQQVVPGAAGTTWGMATPVAKALSDADTVTITFAGVPDGTEGFALAYAVDYPWVLANLGVTGEVLAGGGALSATAPGPGFGTGLSDWPWQALIGVVAYFGGDGSAPTNDPAWDALGSVAGATFAAAGATLIGPQPSPPPYAPSTEVGVGVLATCLAVGVGPADPGSGPFTASVDLAPVNPATWVAENAPAPNGWWPVVPGKRYRWRFDANGIVNADFFADTGGAVPIIDFYSSFATQPYSLIGWELEGGPPSVDRYAAGSVFALPHIEDGTPVAGIGFDMPAPVTAAWAVPGVSLSIFADSGAFGTPQTETRLDNAWWSPVPTPAIPSPTLLVIAAEEHPLLYAISADGSAGVSIATPIGSFDGIRARFNPAKTKIAYFDHTLWVEPTGQRWWLGLMDPNGENPALLTGVPSDLVLNPDLLGGFDFSPDGSKLLVPWVGNFDGGTGLFEVGFSIVNTDNSGHTEIVLGTATGPGSVNLVFTTDGGNVRWSPDGSKFAYMAQGTGTNHTKEIHVCNADGSGVTVVHADNATNSHLAEWFADSAHLLVELVVSGSPTSSFVKMALDGTFTTIASGLQSANDAAAITMSPDQSEIAWIAGTQILMMPVAGGGATPISTGFIAGGTVKGNTLHWKA